MSVSTPPTCVLGLSPADLSAWRDGALSPDAAQRIDAHAVNCPACQRINAADDALAAALRADQPPAPDPHNWLRLQARIAAAQPGRRTTAPRRALWSGLVAAAAVLVISALFFNLFDHLAPPRNGAHLVATPTVSPTPIVTPQPIPTDVPPTVPIAGTPLQWQTREGPADLVPMSAAGDPNRSNAIAFSPADARTAYACSITRGTSVTLDVWATHDGALSWAHMNTSTVDLTWHGCIFNLDAGDPMRVEVTLTTAYGVQTSTSRSLLSDDGGKTWRQIADHLMFSDLVTRGKTSIAIKAQWPLLMPPPAGPPPPNAQQATKYLELVASDDDWRTWRPIGSALVEQGLTVGEVWQRPGDGALLVSASSATGFTNAFDDEQLWQSVDLGAHWTRVPTPTNLFADAGYMVAPPVGDAPWRACGVMYVGKDIGKPTDLVGCTLDGGQTWQTRPMAVFTSLCGNYCFGEALGAPAMLPDGSLLQQNTATVSASGVQQNNPRQEELYILRPHATQWEDIGQVSGGIIVIAGPKPTIVALPGVRAYQIPTGRWGTVSGTFSGDNVIGDAHGFSIATLP